MTHAFQYIKNNGGVDKETAYPYAEKVIIIKSCQEFKLTIFITKN
jgi:hypothetical protein